MTAPLFKSSAAQKLSSHQTAHRETLCSTCGLCEVRAWPAKESIQSCVFKLGWLGEQESNVFGRERRVEDEDEMRFGITRRRFIASLKQPIAEAQWSGIVSHLAMRAFETKKVEAVATLHRSKTDYFFPEPVLATSVEEILAGRGNKPVISPTLLALETAYKQGIRKLMVIGASCHIHVLKDFQTRFDYIREMEIFAVGIPCVDNIKPRKLRWILERISRSHETVRHYEFMQDFNVHLKHENGDLEKVPYFSLPQELAQNSVFAPSCMSCFDYLNGLADITIGYVGAPLEKNKKRQWVMVRTQKGEDLLNLIEHDLEVFPETSAGNRREGVRVSAEQMMERTNLGEAAPVKTGRKIPIWLGRVIAAVMRRIGPRGLEFARYSVDFHLIRNYYFVKKNYPDLLQTLVPKHVYKILKDYGFKA
ncbi:MAG: Coenzyme F420 hydrogenase/dehydrogenase, beta subunit C-terminal domain [Rhizobacter sp.]|nr:Coenzyme F420 hydrogenase/dehydrogenase, beta subunit C-terminal domain [Chlorobiales bacterium]